MYEPITSYIINLVKTVPATVELVPQELTVTVTNRSLHVSQTEQLGDTLEQLSAVKNYNRWIYELIKPFLGKKTLELGAGIGNMTEYISQETHVTATDIDPMFLEQLRIRTDPSRVQVRYLDISSPQIQNPPNAPFDSVICINLLEHISNDNRALQNMLDLTAPGGRVLMLLPACSSLFGSLDRSFGHHRRYSIGRTRSMARSAGARVMTSRYVNLVGAFGWFLYGRILRRNRLPLKETRWFDSLVGPLSKLESRLRLPFGQSVFMVLEKPNDNS